MGTMRRGCQESEQQKDSCARDLISMVSIDWTIHTTVSEQGEQRVMIRKRGATGI